MPGHVLTSTRVDSFLTLARWESTMTKYCPQGDGAFDDWVASCPECGSTLTDTVPDDEFMRQPYDDAPPVLFQTVPNEIEASMLSDILRDANIPVMVRAGGPGPVSYTHLTLPTILRV